MEYFHLKYRDFSEFSEIQVFQKDGLALAHQNLLMNIHCSSSALEAMVSSISHLFLP